MEQVLCKCAFGRFPCAIGSSVVTYGMEMVFCKCALVPLSFVKTCGTEQDLCKRTLVQLSYAIGVLV